MYLLQEETLRSLKMIQKADSDLAILSCCMGVSYHILPALLGSYREMCPHSQVLLDRDCVTSGPANSRGGLGAMARVLLDSTAPKLPQPPGAGVGGAP